MPAQVITPEDLEQFKEEILEKFIERLQETMQANSGSKQKKYLRSKSVREMLDNISPATLQTFRINGMPHMKVGGTFLYDYDKLVEYFESNNISYNNLPLDKTRLL